MAVVKPFKAVRPTKNLVGLITTHAYDSYTIEKREALMTHNPYSFLHIINPNYKNEKEFDGLEKNEKVKAKYKKYTEEGLFIKDETPAYYIYKIINQLGQTFIGIIATTSAEDYEKNIIKKHESTIAKREETMKTYLETVGFNAEPVLLTYSDNLALEKIIYKTQKKQLEYEFITTNNETHSLWKIEDIPTLKAIEKEFANINPIYIADGHHRSASSYLLYKEKKETLQIKPSFKYFMSYLIPESHLVIYGFDRLVKDLNGLSKKDFLIKLSGYYRIENRGAVPYNPSKKHHFSMYLEGEYYSLYLKKNKYKFNTALDDLDAQLLYKTILEPILNIKDLRDNDRIDYINDPQKTDAIKTGVDSGGYKVGFGLCPATINQIKNIANEGLTMPPKSTYILPKLLSGITIYEY